MRKPRAEWTYQDMVAPFAFVVFVAVGWFLAFGLARERYLLRPGVGHYTVGWVAEHYTRRGRHKYVCVYYVRGERWQTGEDCGIADNQALPCPALGTRRYVYYAPEDPGTQLVTAVPVPDTLQHVPPQGWAKLP